MTSQARADHLDPLVKAAGGGDRAAFGNLVSETSALVTSIALAIVRDVDASRDIAQDVFLAAWKDLARLRNPASFLPWLRQITRNQAHQLLRTRVRSRRMQGDGATPDVLESVVDPRPGRGRVPDCARGSSSPSSRSLCRFPLDGS